jgi:hypothetical protein
VKLTAEEKDLHNSFGETLCRDEKQGDAVGWDRQL